MAKHLRKYPVCTNCDFTFTQEQPDNFCPRCGQENHDLNVPFQHVALELLEGTIHYDSKFWSTLKYLFFYPGKLTNEFHRGRRAGYVPPIRLYVFISFVFFFLLSLRIGHTKNGEKTLQEDIKTTFAQTTDSLSALADNPGKAILEKELATARRTTDSLRLTSQDSTQKTAVRQFSLEAVPTAATQAQLDAVLDSLGIATKNWFTRGTLQKVANLQHLPKNELVLKGIKYLSVMMFVLMPVFALLLKLVFYRARRFYMEHLMFSIHLHCFFFVLYILYMLTLYLFTSVDLFSWVNLFGLVYLFLGLKRVFRRSYLRTFFNMGMVLLLYFFTGVLTLLLGLVVSVAL